MHGYYGTVEHQRLQALCEEKAKWTFETPGACFVARLLGTDDPDRLGWDTVFSILGEHGIMGFRMVPTARIDEFAERFKRRGYRFDTWNVLTGDAASVLKATGPILQAPLPAGYRFTHLAKNASVADAGRYQAVMVDSNVVPYSASVLCGSFAPARTHGIENGDGRLVAVSYAYMPHNEFSEFREYAWGGLVAVADTERGKGLGRIVNAQMAQTAVTDLGAKWLYELVSETNLASRRMVEASGLVLDPGWKAGIATRSKTRFTT